MGRRGFPPKSASSTGKSRCSVFRPEFLYVPRAELSPNSLKNQYFAISHPWVSIWPKQTTEKGCAISGTHFWGGRGFPPKSAPSTGKLHFRVFRPGPQFPSVAKAKTGHNTTKSPFPTGGGPTEKTVVPEKGAGNHPPDSVATFLFAKSAPGTRELPFFLFVARARDVSAAQSGPEGH